MRPWVQSVGAVIAGFVVTAGLSTVGDGVMTLAGVFPGHGQVLSEPMFVLATAYRALFTVAGGYATARLAPDRPMRHAWVLAGIGLVAGLGGVVAYFVVGGPQMGPAWYALSIPAEAIPCVWAGAWLALRARSSAA